VVCPLLVAMIFVGFRATKNEHRVLDVRIFTLILVVGTSLAFIRGVALPRLLIAFLGDMLLIHVAIFGEVADQEAVVLAWIVHDLIKLATVILALPLLVVATLLGVCNKFSSTLAIFLP
jgi:hypothetical protein